uniref:WD_REPEATS_REGION domain-containing protein n=1 Tax=Rhodnius prolixus TaxID=13249 RepID=T1HBR0_RHOPR
MDLRVRAKKSSEKKSVPACNFYRETGLYHKTTGPPKYLQWAAEEKLIHKNHEEFTCHIPDATRSTFLMVFSPDGTMIASTHGNHNVYVTYLTSGKNVKTLSGHPRTPWCIAFHPSSNQILASGCLGGQVRVWDLHGGSEIWMAESQTVIASLAFHPTDRVLVIATYNEVHFWDWSQDKPFAKCSTSNEREKVRYVTFDSLGHRLITGIANAPRVHSQWDRVSAPQPPPQIPQSEHERRITICYRYMVEQYEQLVQRYYTLSRQGASDQQGNSNSRASQPVTVRFIFIIFQSV